jgi:hypothetical protein
MKEDGNSFDIHRIPLTYSGSLLLVSHILTMDSGAVMRYGLCDIEIDVRLPTTRSSMSYSRTLQTTSIL